MDATKLLERFNAERDPSHAGRAYCPVHEADGKHNPSLIIDFNDAGMALLHCESKGCRNDDIVAAIGLTLRDLRDVTDIAPSDMRRAGGKLPIDDIARADALDTARVRAYALANGGDGGEFLRRGFDPAGRTAEELLAYGIGWDAARAEPTYTTFTDAGKVAYTQRRTDDPRSRWKCDKAPEGQSWDVVGFVGPRHPGSPLVVCEGPADGLTLATLGTYDVAAVRGAAMASKAVDALVDIARGRDVILAGDNDDAGREFNNTLHAGLTGVARSVRAVVWPAGAPDKYDVGDLRDDNPVGFLEALGALVSDVAVTTEAPSEFYNERSMSDAHVSERVARDHLRGTLYAYGKRSWAAWDGKRWHLDASDDIARRRVRDALLSIQAEELDLADQRRDEALARAARMGDQTEAKQAINAAHAAHSSRVKGISRLNNVGAIDAAMKLARGHIIVDPATFDAHPDLVNTPSGIVDLTTGALIPHDPELKLTTMTNVDYMPGATHPLWDKALEAIPEDNREWLQVRLGQALTGYQPEDDRVLILQGLRAANGKSTILGGIAATLGNEYAVTLNDKLLQGGKNDHPTEQMVLRGARLAILEELPEGDYLDATRVKKITGSPNLSGRYIGQDNITFPLTHALFITTNYEVQMAAADAGTWRRFYLVDFPYSYEGPEKNAEGDPTLKPKVMRDPLIHEAILAWLIAGAMEWYANDRLMPQPPARVVDDTERWRLSANVAVAFMDEFLERDDTSCVLAREVFAEFDKWTRDANRRPMVDKTFWTRAKSHPWFSSGEIGKSVVRTNSWTVSHLDFMVKTPARTTAVTGVRWKTDDAQEEVA